MTQNFNLSYEEIDFRVGNMIVQRCSIKDQKINITNLRY